MEDKSPKTKRKYNKIANEYEITYENYQTYNIDLKKYKICELKSAIKCLGNIRLTGNKQQLIERITIRFNEIKHSIMIQRIFRGWYVRFIQKLRGPALKNRCLCTNDSDMATLEPINEITTPFFFSYKDDKDFIYGFDISSLIPHIQSKGKFVNPYTRESVSNKIAKNAFKVYRGSYAIFAEFRENNKKLDAPSKRRQYTASTMLSIQQRMESLRNQFQESDTLSANFTIIQTRLSQLRNQTIDERIMALFVEIDQLGNYTQHSWFGNLRHRELVLFYRALHDIWYYRAGLAYQTKRNICYGVSQNASSPFTRHRTLGYREVSFLEYNELKSSCLEVFEHLVYCGIDNDHKKIGTLHALSALTLVSRDARLAMPWLYESVI
jgi:hypothetical protein